MLMQFGLVALDRHPIVGVGRADLAHDVFLATDGSQRDNAAFEPQ